MNDAFRRTIAKGGSMPSPAHMAEAGEAAAAKVRESYLNAPGPEVSERQEARKRGTPGEGRTLVGTKGPRLIDHIESEVRK